MYPLIAYTLNKVAEMEEKFLQKEPSTSSLNLPFAINDDNEESTLVRRTTFDESRNVEHQVRYCKLFQVARFTLGIISQILVYTTATYL
jgi:hypothetical protein